MTRGITNQPTRKETDGNSRRVGRSGKQFLLRPGSIPGRCGQQGGAEPGPGGTAEGGGCFYEIYRGRGRGD